VSESDILGLIDYFSDIEILVSFERDMFADYSFKNEDIPIFHVYITMTSFRQVYPKSLTLTHLCLQAVLEVLFTQLLCPFPL